MTQQVPSGILGPLYQDVRTAVVTGWRWVSRILSDSERPHFTSPGQLKAALGQGGVKDGQRLTLLCKVSPFGPFLRNHFLTPMIGHRSDLRLGPHIGAAHPILGLFAQVSTHYQPVGLCPPVSNDAVQAFAYPPATPTTGLVGLLPGVSQMVDHVHVLLRPDQHRYYGRTCTLQGVLRLITPADFENAGLSIEIYEQCRQLGDIYFIDCTLDDAEWRITDDAPEAAELWGGLYAHGHIESDDLSLLKIADIVEVMTSAAKRASSDVLVSQNKAGRKEIAVYGRGIRCVLDTQAPVWCIHMDVELCRGYAATSAQFEEVLSATLAGVEDVATTCGASLTNPRDVDFTYLDAAKSHSVLRSNVARQVANPVLVLVRDWHRRRNQDSAA